MTEVIIKEIGECEKGLLFKDLKAGDLFIWKTDNLGVNGILIKSDSGGHSYLNSGKYYGPELMQDSLVTRLSKVTITYEVE